MRQTASQTIVRGARVLGGDAADLRLRDGVISEIGRAHV